MPDSCAVGLVSVTQLLLSSSGRRRGVTSCAELVSALELGTEAERVAVGMNCLDSKPGQVTAYELGIYMYDRSFIASDHLASGLAK